MFNSLHEEEPTQWTDTEIQEYLLIEGLFDSYQINIRLDKIPVTLLSTDIMPKDIVPLIISPLIPPIIKPTSSFGNTSTNNPLPATFNSQILASQGYGKKLANMAKM